MGASNARAHEPKAHFEQKFTMVLERFLIDIWSYLRQFVFHSISKPIDVSKRQCKCLVLIVILDEHAKGGILKAISSTEGELNCHGSSEKSEQQSGYTQR